METYSSSRVDVVGVLDGDRSPWAEGETCEEILARLQMPVIGELDDLSDVLREVPIDEVHITLPMKSCYAEIDEMMRICEEAGVAVSLSLDLFDREIARPAVKRQGRASRLHYSCVSRARCQLALKRLVDILGSLAALTVLGLPMLAIAAAIKATSRGPVLFRQRRSGLNHRPFEMLKFRTMVADAEARKGDLRHLNEMSGPAFKIKDDPRITSVGRFLRKYSLDELPQFINVLRGEMSLVGPRPPIVVEVEDYEWWQRRRMSTKPGLTCFWQVSGRNEIDFEEWMRLDLKYIDSWSLWLDLKLILKTIPAVLRGSGAS